MPAPRRSAQLGTLLAGLAVVAGCGTTEPEPLQAIEPDIPADLCATVPAAARAGLLANSNTDQTGNPTAACSLRSPDNAGTQVQAVVTWVQTSTDETGIDVLDSQCRAIDRTEFREQAGFQAQGADKACAASGKINGADSATLAALSGREVVTVRVSSEPPDKVTAIDRGQQMLEGVLGSLAGS
jgi:hypothetical protein